MLSRYRRFPRRWTLAVTCGAFPLHSPSFWRWPRRHRERRGHEFTPSWGHGLIDDKPFNEPPPGGALLPASAGLPARLHPLTVPDGGRSPHRLRLHAWHPHAAAQYHIDEGDFENASIDRRLDIAPSAMSYLATTSAASSVERRRRRMRRHPPHRPLGPDPDADSHPEAGRHRRPPTPTATACDPGRLLGRERHRLPGAKDIRDLIDDDCAHGDAPARITATIGASGRSSAAGCASINSASATRREARRGSRCHGEALPFTRRTATANAKGKARLRRF